MLLVFLLHRHLRRLNSHTLSLCLSFLYFAQSRYLLASLNFSFAVHFSLFFSFRFLICKQVWKFSTKVLDWLLLSYFSFLYVTMWFFFLRIFVTFIQRKTEHNILLDFLILMLIFYTFFYFQKIVLRFSEVSTVKVYLVINWIIEWGG